MRYTKSTFTILYYTCNVAGFSNTAPQPLPLVEQLTITKLLGVYISATFSADALVEHILSVNNQRM